MDNRDNFSNEHSTYNNDNYIGQLQCKIRSLENQSEIYKKEISILEEKIKVSGLEVKITEGNNYDLFSVADLALATSGTVTLEAALCGLGSVIVYKTNPVTYFIAKLVVNIPHIGLPNIVAAKSVLPELIQNDFTPAKVAQEALALLESERNAKMKEDLAYVKERLGKPGAVGRVAELVLKIAGEKR